MGFDLRVKPEWPKLGGEDDTSHWHCCIDENVSLCGFDISDFEEAEFEESNCHVCEDLVYTAHCPLLGDDKCVEA